MASHSRAALVHQRAIWKAAGQTVVFTNGCYDLLHPGHVRLLEQAAICSRIASPALPPRGSIGAYFGNSTASDDGKKSPRRSVTYVPTCSSAK